MFEKNSSTLVIRDNALTDELRKRCQDMISMLKSMELAERRQHFEELHILLDDILNNKNINYTKAKEELCSLPIVTGLEIATICDKETEAFVKDIFAILTNEVKD